MRVREADVRTFILAELSEKIGADESEALRQGGDLDLFGSGVLSSLDFVELIAHLEARFNVQVDFENEDPVAYTTLSGLARILAAAGAGDDGLSGR